MKVRFSYHCSRCGSTRFRRSQARSFGESILGRFGIHAQRCHMCRSRFFLFKPEGLRTFLAALDAPAHNERERPTSGAPIADPSDA